MSFDRDAADLRRDFSTPPMAYRPIAFVRLDGDFSNTVAVDAMLDDLKAAGYGGIAPIPTADEAAPTHPAPFTEDYFQAYGVLLGEAKKRGLQVVYYDDADIPSGRYGGEIVRDHPELRAQYLIMREYECTEGEVTRRRLDTGGVTLSVVAHELDTGEIIDLREELMDDTVVWDTPEGNWNILQFMCCINEATDMVDLLSYEASYRFAEKSYGGFCSRFAPYIGDVVKMTWYSDLQYVAPNRRMWSRDFNAFFEAEFGFDPAPYYPALFYDIGPKTEYYTACFMRCRAKMLSQGFFRAVADYTADRGLLCSGSVSEAKTAACSNLTGDTIGDHALAGAPGVEMSHAYMYGFNGIKPVASAAYNYGRELVPCHLFRDYVRLDPRILYKETMNVFARGANLVMPHISALSDYTEGSWQGGGEKQVLHDSMPRYNTFAARCQTLLSGGAHVCDIAMVYPIDALHSKVYLYEQKERPCEYPPVYAFADYISNINAVMNFCGRDLTLLHPDVLGAQGRVEDGILHVDVGQSSGHYRILILPAMNIVSIRILRLVRDFFDCGGKIIATSALPMQVTEDDEDLRREAAEIINYVFGVSDNVVNYVSDYEMHRNEKGGMAIYLRSSMTDLDGTEYVEAHRLNETLWRFDTPVDIVFEHLPRIAQSGILALNLLAFRNSGAMVVENIRSGGVFNYIHRRHRDRDVYYISNTTVRDYAGKIFIHGVFAVEAWNPHTGAITPLNGGNIRVGAHTYTYVEASIPKDTSLFLVCRTADAQTEMPSFSDFAEAHDYFSEASEKKGGQRRQRLFRTGE